MIKIELTDLPEFEKDLKITITLQKDQEGNVGENVKVFPDSSLPDYKSLEFTNKKEQNTVLTSQVISEEGKEKEEIVNNLSISSSPMSSETKDSSSVKQKSPKKKKVSGNLMDLDF